MMVSAKDVFFQIQIPFQAIDSPEFDKVFFFAKIL